ncbi:MAG: MCE family protein [Hyphomicrobiales bacterium]|nr:MCE family protein [Hyphomicrobiales bacterium]
MSEEQTQPADQNQPYDAAIRPARRRFSIVWLVPLVAVLIGAWLVYETLTEKGPEITIRFDTAEGLEAGKTKIKYKDVEAGAVKSIRFSEDLSHILVTAEMAKEFSDYLTENTRFWVVRPRLTASGVSGLGTLLSGAYIAIDPASGQGASKTKFVGLEEPPVVASNVPGKEFKLKSDKLGSLSAGAPIYYRSVKVGEVMGYELSDDFQEITVPIFIRKPFDGLVRAETRFWNVSGVDASVSAQGVQIQTESIQAILTGGIAFETPKHAMGREPSQAGAVFRLFDSKSKIAEAQYTIHIPYLVRFNGSVRGLTVGAPVEFRGIKLGTVTDITLDVDPDTLEVSIPVEIELQPQRLSLSGTNTPSVLADAADSYERAAILVERGLRAQLDVGSILTGQLFVALDFFPDAPPAKLKRDGRYPEIPTIPSDIEKFTSSASQILEKIGKLPLEDLLEELRTTVSSVNQSVNSAAVQDAVASLANVKPLIESARVTMDRAAATMTSAEEVVGPNSQVKRDLIELLRELKGTARSLRVLSDYLERHPEALIRGKGGSDR